MLWSLSRLKQWEEYLSTIPSSLQFKTLMYVCDHIRTDLTTKIKNPTIQYQLAPLTEACKTIIDVVDPQQSMFESMEQADTAINQLYSLIGFSRPDVTGHHRSLLIVMWAPWRVFHALKNLARSAGQLRRDSSSFRLG